MKPFGSITADNKTKKKKDCFDLDLILIQGNTVYWARVSVKGAV